MRGLADISKRSIALTLRRDRHEGIFCRQPKSTNTKRRFASGLPARWRVMPSLRVCKQLARRKKLRRCYFAPRPHLEGTEHHARGILEKCSALRSGLLPTQGNEEGEIMNRIESPFGFHSTAEEVIGSLDLRGKRAIVTGGGSGIGAETVRVLALAGAEVTLLVRTRDAGESVAAEIRRNTGNNLVYLAVVDLV